MEAQYIARRAWPDLAQFYRARIAEADSAADRVDWLVRLAELLEDELDDPEGAVGAWAEVVRESGDDVALREQMRLLARRDDASGIWRALDGAVLSAADALQRARALTLRGEARLRTGDHAGAREDFELALKATPGHLPALVGRAEAEPNAELLSSAAAALAEAPRRFPGRVELHRRLARLAESDPDASAIAIESWREVIAETPDDEEALSQVTALSRRSGDDETLAAVLEVWLEHAPRGLDSRAAWIDRATALERLDRADEALEVLRSAVRLEPGHQEAWLALFERCDARGLDEEAAWALEHAATSTEDEKERAGLWLRLAAFVRDRLKDTGRAEVYGGRGRRVLEAAADEEAARAPTALEVPVVEDVLEVTSGDVVIDEWDEPSQPTPSSPAPSLKRLRDERAALVEQVRARPLDPTGYRRLGEFFGKLEDDGRRQLMLEIASALEGEPAADVPAPRLILSSTDRAGLRHPALRGEDGELLALAGHVLCRRLAPSEPFRSAGGLEPFGLDLGRGAEAAAEALFSAVRVLGLPAPDVFVSAELGPPFSLSSGKHAPRLLVGRAAIRRSLPDAELRFFAGRALFTQNPELMVLRTLDRERLARGMAALSSPGRGSVREALSPRALKRIDELLPRLPRRLPVQQLSDAARHSANRAGLVVCGAVAPALAALRAKKALESEILELVRFAGSERYLQLRRRCG